MKTKIQRRKNRLNESVSKKIMNSLFGCQIRKDVDTAYHCKSVHWMKTEIDEIFSGYWSWPNGNYIVKMKKDVGVDNDMKKL